MNFSKVIGHPKLKEKILEAIRENRISHAQLFQGPQGNGGLAMTLALSQYLLCENKGSQDACNQCSNCRYFEKFSHPDLHFLYPQVLAKKQEDRMGRFFFLENFKSAITQNPYLTLENWYNEIDLAGKQGLINVEDVNQLSKKLFLKSYLGGPKIVIIWMAEFMNDQAANKMLKIFEEPPEKTYFFLVSENSEAMLPTVLSRMQLIKVPKVEQSEVLDYLSSHAQLEFHKAHDMAKFSDGNMNLVFQMMNGNATSDFVKQIREWFLLCFEFPKKGKELLAWVEKMSEHGREENKQFIFNSMQVIREAFLTNVTGRETEKFSGEEVDFINKFSKYIHHSNVNSINLKLNDAHYHIERNAHVKTLLLNLSLEMGRLLTSKP